MASSEIKKVRAINRLQTTREVRAMVDKMYADGIEAAKGGSPTTWAMVNWWHADPILKAMGMVVIYPENYGAVCAAAGAAPEYLARCETEGFPTHLCGYARNTIGYTQKMIELGEVPADAPMGGMAKPMLLLSAGHYCDARFKWFQSLGRYMEVPVYVLDLPHPGVKESGMEGVADYSISYMVKELREFVAFMERLMGKRIDRDLLSEVVRNQESVFRVWYEVNDLRKADPCPMHSRDFWTLMVPCLYLAGEKASLEAYEKVRDEVKDRVANRIGAGANEKYRLLFAELPPWHSLGFFDQLAEMGWNFVEESWNYHPPPPLELEGINDPLERIARYTYWYYVNPNSEARAADRTAGAVVEPYIHWAREYRCDGALLHPLISCRTNAIYPMHLQDLLLRDAKIPSLVVQGDIVDLSVFDENLALNQAQAFMETMEHYRDIRRKEGLDC